MLVVEDDEQVRLSAIDLLSELGYRVLKAKDVQSALAVLETGISIDLIFTDVVMPGQVRSTELARQAARLSLGRALHFRIHWRTRSCTMVGDWTTASSSSVSHIPAKQLLKRFAKRRESAVRQHRLPPGKTCADRADRLSDPHEGVARRRRGNDLIVHGGYPGETWARKPRTQLKP